MINEEFKVVPFIKEYSLLISLVILGATAGTLNQLSEARRLQTTFTWIDMVIAFIVSVFSGVVFGLTADFFWDDLRVLYGVSAMGAFLGINGLNKITELLIEVLEQRAKRGKDDDK